MSADAAAGEMVEFHGHFLYPHEIELLRAALAGYHRIPGHDGMDYASFVEGAARVLVMARADLKELRERVAVAERVARGVRDPLIPAGPAPADADGLGVLRGRLAASGAVEEGR